MFYVCRLEETRIRAEAEELNKVKRDKEYQVSVGLVLRGHVLFVHLLPTRE